MARLPFLCSWKKPYFHKHAQLQKALYVRLLLPLKTYSFCDAPCEKLQHRSMNLDLSFPKLSETISYQILVVLVTISPNVPQTAQNVITAS